MDFIREAAQSKAAHTQRRTEELQRGELSAHRAGQILELDQAVVRMLKRAFKRAADAIVPPPSARWRARERRRLLAPLRVAIVAFRAALKARS